MANILAAILAFIIATPVVILVMGLGVLIRGFVLMKLWSWFIVGTFGLHPLSLAAAWGVSAVIGFAVGPHYAGTQGMTAEQKKEHNINHIGGPFLLLLMGYIVHRFFM